MQTLFPLILSNTDSSLLSMCKLRWFRERAQCLRKPSFNQDLVAGGSFAKGLELTRIAYYNDKLPSNEAIAIGYENILESMHSAMAVAGQDTDVLKSPERMALALRAYFKRFPLEEDEVIPALREDGSYAIEHTMVCELPILHPELNVPLLFKAKLDMLATEMGRNYIVDEKTCKAISAGEGALLATAGQFVGYAWAAREKEISVQGSRVRKVAILKNDIKVEEFANPITEFMVDRWYDSFLGKINELVFAYSSWIQDKEQLPHYYFEPDYQLGCTSYFKPCPFQDGCTSVNGEKFLNSSFNQVAWDSEERKEIPLTEYRQLLGLDS